MTEDEVVRWHHQLNGHEFEQASGVDDGQGILACCGPLGHKELDTRTMCGLIRQRHRVQFTHRLLKENESFTGHRQCSDDL